MVHVGQHGHRGDLEPSDPKPSPSPYPHPHPHPYQVIEATKPSVDRCWYELIGSCGFFGKGLLDCEKYIVKVIGTPEKLIEALPVDIMSHDTPEGFLLRPCFADHVTMEEEPARNFITFESQTTRWMVDQLLP